MAWGTKDIRNERRGDAMLDAIVAKGSLVLRKVGGGRAGEIATGRFLDHDDVTVAAIMATAAERTLAAAAGRTVLAIHDTTEVNFKGRAARRKGLGPAGDGVSPGFFCHPLLLVDVAHEAVLGLAAADIWTRPAAPVGDRAKRDSAEKESRRWLDATRGLRKNRRNGRARDLGRRSRSRYLSTFRGAPRQRRHDRARTP